MLMVESQALGRLDERDRFEQKVFPRIPQNNSPPMRTVGHLQISGYIEQDLSFPLNKMEGTEMELE